MRIPKWLLVGLLLTGGTHQVCGDFRSHLSSPAVVLPEPANTVTPVPPAPASISSLLSNLVSSITTQDAATQPQPQPQPQPQSHQIKRGTGKGKGKKGKGNGKAKGNKGVSASASASMSQSRVPGLTFLLRADDDDDSSSSSEDTGPVDNMLNEDADVLAAQENLSVGAMSSEGLDQQHTSSSSDEPSPPKIPNLAQQLLAQAQHKQAPTPVQTQPQTQTQTATKQATSTPTPSTPTPSATETDPDTDTDADPESEDTETETQTETEPETQSIVSYSPMSRTISMSPFVRLTIATGRDSRFGPRVLGFGSDPLQQVWAELRASLRQDMMSMWRESLSQHGSSQVMRVFPIGSNARVSVIHIHDEPAISQHQCRADAQRLCASEMSSHNMLDTMACLGRHEASVSEQCAHEIAHCPAVACAQDVQQLCTPEERVSRSSVMECLARHHDQLSARCQSAAGTDTAPTGTGTTTTTTAAVETESHAETATPTSASQGAISPLSAFGWGSSSDFTSDSSSSTTSTSVSSSVVVGLTILPLLLVALSGGLYAHLRRISREQHIKLEQVHDEEEMQHA